MKKVLSVVVVMLVIGLLVIGCSTSGSSEETKEIEENGFLTKDLNGKEVKPDIFKDYDLTMVNIWATWCGPCVDEMPELQKVYQQLPENVNMIGICTDGEKEKEIAQEIIKSAGVEFYVFSENDRIKRELTGDIPSLPTTIFVDKEGNIVGKTLIGVPSKNVVEYYLDAINNTLNELNL